MSSWESAGKSDEWYTPKYIFDALRVEFEMDVAAPLDRTYISVPAKRFVHRDSLDHPWEGFVWMNPPFGGRNGITPWLNKIALHGNGIALTPDRTSTTWWQWAASRADLILFIHGKVKFIRADGTEGKSPSTGTTLLAYGGQAIKALLEAERNTLGTTYTNRFKLYEGNEN